MDFLQKNAHNLVEMGESIDKFSNFDCECSAKKIYETRYGTTHADCIHTCINNVRKRRTPEIIIELIENDENEIKFIDSDMKWPSNNKSNKNIKKSITHN